MTQLTDANFRLSPFLQKLILITLVLTVAIISRLPQLLSPHLLLDGDEAIVGLMAKHITEGKSVTLYFYGQKYGFAYPEALAGAISFKLFGYGALQLKAAMLAFWLGGLAFFYFTAAKIMNPVRGFWLALLFALFPAWAVWSLKARGGYLTSFFLASIILYLFVNRKKDFPAISWLGIGILLGLVFYAQAFWLAGLFPFIAWHFYRFGKLRSILWLGLGITMVAGFFLLFGHATSNFWHPSIIGGNKHFFAPWQKLPERFFTHLTGYYYLNYIYKPNAFSRILTVAWIVLFVCFTGFQLYRIGRYLASIRSRKLTDFILKHTGAPDTYTFLLQKFNMAPETEKPVYLRALGNAGFADIHFLQNIATRAGKKLRTIAARNLFSFGTETGHLLFLAVCFTLGYCLFFNETYYGFRYLLPLSGFMILWIGTEASYLHTLRLIPKTALLVILAVFIGIGGISLYNFRNYSFLKYTELQIPKTGTEEERLASLFAYLEKNNVRHVYSTDQLLEWFVPFYSQEKIIARALPPVDRYPEYVQKVNKAYKQGKPTALISYYPPDWRVTKALDSPKKVQRIGHWYYVYLNPTPEELGKIGYYKKAGILASDDFVNKRMQ